MVASTAPSASTRRSAKRGVGGAYRQASQHPITPIGTLMKKIARHPNEAIRKPPMTGPPDSAELAPATNFPTARDRCPGSRKAWLSSASAQEPAAPPPAPAPPAPR